MIPGVNANAVTASVPTPGEPKLIMDPPPKPAHITVCNQCFANKAQIEKRDLEIAKLNELLDATRAEGYALAQRLDAASGVSVNMRQADTIKRLQRAEEIVRNTNDYLEQENMVLRALLTKAGVDFRADLDLAMGGRDRPS